MLLEHGGGGLSAAPTAPRVRRRELVVAEHRMAGEEVGRLDDESGKKGSVWADPVECLLDLHELRLDAQAHALVEHLRREGT